MNAALSWALCLFGLPLTLVASSRPQDGNGKDAIEKDKNALEGAWILVRVELYGFEQYPGPFKKKKPSSREPNKLIFEKDKLTWDKGKGTTPYITLFKIDPTKSPKHLDSITEHGSFWLGIYKIEGDTLSICWNGANDKERPTEFRTTPSQKGLRLWQLKRPEPAQKPK